MLIGTLDEVEFAPEYPELQGKRVLVTGVADPVGVEIVRAFAEARTRLIVQACEDSPEMQALAEIIAPEAMDVEFYPGGLADNEAMVRFAREAAQKFGGLDCVVNLASVPEPPAHAGEADIEGMVTEALAMPVLATRVVANRMRTMLAPGALLNVLAVPRNASAGRLLVAGIARNALAGFTRTEAASVAGDGIRINGVVPATGPDGKAAAMAGIVDVATLALHLASGRGHELSGVVFEAWCG
jgi:NAD(P)-dependent dehydrogenase (short-subunit alcohol dehydrogenase family)